MKVQCARPGKWLALVGLGLATLASIHVVVTWAGGTGGPRMVEQRVLLDTDSYTWLNRATELRASGDWFDHTYPRVNPPEGHQQHWTRPLDAILLAGGAVLGLRWGFEDGLYRWALVVSPLFHLLTFLALIWAARVPHHSVLSIPNHRFQPGYTFTHEVLSHPGPAEAAERLRKRGVGVVVLCAEDITSGFFSYPDPQTAFVDWLADGGIPEGYALHVATPAVRIYRRES